MQSMTGFGRSVVNSDGREVTVELKSVNHRFLDISVEQKNPLRIFRRGFLAFQNSGLIWRVKSLFRVLSMSAPL